MDVTKLIGTKASTTKAMLPAKLQVRYQQRACPNPGFIGFQLLSSQVTISHGSH